MEMIVIIILIINTAFATLSFNGVLRLNFG
jgi:hypothetical protein